MTMINALQGVDAMVGGFEGCMDILRDRNQQQAEQSQLQRLCADYNALSARHNKLLAERDANYALYKAEFERLQELKAAHSTLELRAHRQVVDMRAALAVEKQAFLDVRELAIALARQAGGDSAADIISQHVNPEGARQHFAVTISGVHHNCWLRPA